MGCVGSSGKVKPDANANEIYSSKKNRGKNAIDDSGKSKTPLRGDVTQRVDARKDREKRIKDKQQKIAFAAEEMSSKVMDERERLSLSTRATSRATSRTSSPTLGARKHVQFRDARNEERGTPVYNQTSDNKDRGTVNGHVTNGIIPQSNSAGNTRTTVTDDAIIDSKLPNGGKRTDKTGPTIIVTRTSGPGKENGSIIQNSPVRKAVAVS